MTDLTPRDHGAALDASRRKRRWAPIIMVALVLIAGGVIVTQFLRSAVDYYCNVDEVGSRSGCEADRRLRIQGVVERGTVVSDGATTTFTIEFGGEQLDVDYNGEPGGIFKECIPVVVHGRLDSSSNVFHGDRVEVKHSNEYVAVNDERLEDAEELADACDAEAA